MFSSLTRVPPHVVTAEESELAASLQKRRWADLGMKPGRIEQLLEQQAVGATGPPNGGQTPTTEADVAPVTPMVATQNRELAWAHLTLAFVVGAVLAGCVSACIVWRLRRPRAPDAS